MENSEEGLILKRDREKRDADAALLTACEGRYEANAFEALQNGANPNVIDENGKTPLMHVMEWHRDYWDEAERLVRELLHQGALVNTVNADGMSLLHQAVRSTSFEIVKMLVEKCPSWRHLTAHEGHYNLLMEVIWFRRWHDEASEEERVKIAGLFVSQIHTKSPDFGFSPLDLACTDYASPKMVDFLLKNKADPNVENRSGRTPLYSAVQCDNPMTIVPLLLSAGADPKRKDVLMHVYTEGRADVLDLLFRSTPNLNTIISFNGPTLPSVTHPDYLGMISVAKRHKARTGMIGPEIFKSLVQRDQKPDRVCWAASRFASNRFNDTGSDFFLVMAACNSVDLWRYFANDYAGTTHASTGNTLLHIAAREKKVFAIPILMQRNMNPFWRNHKDQTALDVAREVNCPEIVALLSDYACFRPTRVHARWFGPYFLSRAYTFLLAVLRLEPKLPRDVVHLILYHLGQMESV